MGGSEEQAERRARKKEAGRSKERSSLRHDRASEGLG
jgi:hypothetical protein